MKKYLVIFLSLFFIGCGDSATKEEEGAKCTHFVECKDNEICVSNHCKLIDDSICTIDSECPTDTICHPLDQTCQPKECSSHNQCGIGQFCVVYGYCKSTCLSNDDCGNGYTCNFETGSCDSEDPQGCENVTCDEGYVCDPITSECIPNNNLGCQTNIECEACELCVIPDGERYGQCEEDPNYCANDNDCPENYKCKSNNRCEPIGGEECTIGGTECSATGEYCNPDTHTCVQCLENAHCTTGECNLQSKTCVVPLSCESDSNCPEGLKCIMDDGMIPGMGGSGTGTCKEVVACYTDDDCTEDGQMCKIDEGATQGYCAAEVNFGFGELLGFCIPGVLDCGSGECVDFKCEGGTGGSCNAGNPFDMCTIQGGQCVNGQCVNASEPECNNNSDCEPRGDNLVCQGGQCIEDPTPRCSTEAECETETMHMHCDMSDGICYSCVTDSHCPSNSTCRNHNCVNSSFCTRDSDCPSGQHCISNLCE